MISAEMIEAIKDLSPIEHVIGEHVQLRRTGAELIGRCPFHEDRTPSFAVNPGKGVFRCHGCQAGGGVLEFVKLLHGLSFRRAIEHLAIQAGIQIEEFKPSPELAAKVQAIKTKREDELAFKQFSNQRIAAVNERYRDLARAARHAEECLRAGESDPYIQEIAWAALERYRLFEARIEREGLCDLNVLRTEWSKLRDAA
jgi:DNA primase